MAEMLRDVMRVRVGLAVPTFQRVERVNQVSVDHGSFFGADAGGHASAYKISRSRSG